MTAGLPHTDRGRTSRRAFSRRAALAAEAGVASMAGAWPGTKPSAAQEATPARGTSVTDPVARSVPRVFADDDFQFQFLFTVGQAYERAADVGECFAAAAAIQAATTANSRSRGCVSCAGS